MKKISILGINVNISSKIAIINQIIKYFNSSETRQIVTVNPEIILKAIKDEEYFYVINHADLNTVDGTGVKLACWFVGKFPKRFTGVEITVKLFDYCLANSKAITIINWNEGLSKNLEILEGISKLWPGIDLRVIDVPKSREINQDLINKLNLYTPDLILNTLGNPEQEIMLSKLKGKVSSAKILIGIGGTIDYLIGKKKNTPKIYSQLGLEWLWRLLRQPIKDLPVKRSKRIYNAFFKFIGKFIDWRFILPFRYRDNVACFLYKKQVGRIKVLIVERQDESGHWQLPQGGTEGESLTVAGKKEICEEIGSDKVKTKITIPNLYKYKFHFTQKERERSSYYRGSVYLKHTGFRGQKQGLWIGEYLGTDDSIKLKYWDHSGWKWVNLENLVEFVHESRKTPTKKFVKEFNKIIN